MASFDEFTLTQNLSGWTGAELEFLAEESFVDIKPTFTSEIIPLLGGNAARPVGPFRPPLPASVPLWMAVQIKKARTGEIVCPAWLSVSYLDDWLLREQTSEQFCVPPCEHFVEVARVLITYAREDLGADIVLVEDRLRSVVEHRQAKIERGFQTLTDASDSIRMNNLGSAEVNTLRSFATTSLAAFKRLHSVASGAAAADSSQSSQPVGAGMMGSQGSAAQASQHAAAAAAMPVAQSRNSLRHQATRQLHQAAAATSRAAAGAAGSASAAASSSSAASQSSSQPGAPQQQPPQDDQQRKLRKFR